MRGDRVIASIKLLGPPEYSYEEQQALIELVLALRKLRIQDFLKEVDISGYSGTKEDLRARIQEALDDGEITYPHLVAFLDAVAPWGKQHVFLYRGPQTDVQAWKDLDHVHDLLKRHRVGRLFNARLPLILPDKLTLSSVTHVDGTLRVTAVQKREYRERVPDLDEEKVKDGEKIFLKAYKAHVTRTLAAFEWDLNANAAMLQITQLQEDGDYEKLAEQLSGLVGPWLDVKQFGLVNLRPAIRTLHETEATGQSEVRSHGVDYLSLQNKRVSVRSASARHSAVGEQHIDEAMDLVRKGAVGSLGNFYWLPEKKPGPATNPLKSEVHAIMVGAKSRINFPTPNTEDVVRYVLHRVRSISRTTR